MIHLYLLNDDDDSPRLAAHLGRLAEYFHHGGPDGQAVWRCNIF